MAVPQKDVFYALLRNHNTSATKLCKQAGVSYNMTVKRLVKGTLHRMGLIELTKLCAALDVSSTEFIDLMEKAADGEFDDDYPLDSFKLPAEGSPFVEERSVFAMLTPEEFEMVEAMRKIEKKSVNAVIRVMPGGNKK